MQDNNSVNNELNQINNDDNIVCCVRYCPLSLID